MKRFIFVPKSLTWWLFEGIHVCDIWSSVDNVANISKNTFKQLKINKSRILYIVKPVSEKKQRKENWSPAGAYSRKPMGWSKHIVSCC